MPVGPDYYRQSSDSDDAMDASQAAWNTKYLKHANSPDARRMMKDVGGPGHLRILVVGASGAGKSTLLRCMGFRDKDGGAPMSSSGRPGKQDIRKAWERTHPRRLPLFIHDTNGIDSDGKARVEEITQFLKERQQLQFRDRVHLIWYVLKATDNRVLESAGLMAAVAHLATTQFIHLQIIVTHMDDDSRLGGGPYRTNIAQHLDELLEGVEPSILKELKENIVRISNRSESDYAAEEDEDDGNDPEAKLKRAERRKAEKLKQEGELRMLSDKTMAVLKTDKQKLTWAAAQSVDVTAKLHQTAEIIASKQYLTALTSVLTVVPGVNETALTTLLQNARKDICLIWGAPTTLSEAMWASTALGILIETGFGSLPAKLTGSALTGSAVSCAPMAVLAKPLSLGVAMVTGLVTWVGLSIRETCGTASRQAFVHYCLLVAACILTVREIYPGTWANKTQEEYTVVIEDTFRPRIGHLKDKVHSLKIRGLIEGLLLHGKEASVNEIEHFLTELFNPTT